MQRHEVNSLVMEHSAKWGRELVSNAKMRSRVGGGRYWNGIIRT